MTVDIYEVVEFFFAEFLFFACKVTENKSNMQAFYIFMNVQLLKNNIFMNVQLLKNNIFMNVHCK